jgi:hypothetical protein
MILTIQDLHAAREQLLRHPATLSHASELAITVGEQVVTFSRENPGEPWFLSHNSPLFLLAFVGDGSHVEYDPSLRPRPYERVANAVSITDLCWAEQSLQPQRTIDPAFGSVSGRNPCWVQVIKAGDGNLGFPAERITLEFKTDYRWTQSNAWEAWKKKPRGHYLGWEFHRCVVADFKAAEPCGITPDATLDQKLIALARALAIQVELNSPPDMRRALMQEVYAGTKAFARLLHAYSWKDSMIRGDAPAFNWGYEPVRVILTLPGHHGVTTPDDITLNGVVFREEDYPGKALTPEDERIIREVLGEESTGPSLE